MNEKKVEDGVQQEHQSAASDQLNQQHMKMKLSSSPSLGILKVHLGANERYEEVVGWEWALGGRGE